MVEALGNEYARQEIHPNYLLAERIYGSTDDIWRMIRQELSAHPFVEFMVVGFDGSILIVQTEQMRQFQIPYRAVFETGISFIKAKKSNSPSSPIT